MHCCRSVFVAVCTSIIQTFPHVTTPEIHACEGQNITISCHYANDPLPKDVVVTWYYSRKNDSNSRTFLNHYCSLVDGLERETYGLSCNETWMILTVHNISIAYAGNYTCRLNSANHPHSSCQVIVGNFHCIVKCT